MCCLIPASLEISTKFTWIVVIKFLPSTYTITVISWLPLLISHTGHFEQGRTFFYSQTFLSRLFYLHALDCALQPPSCRFIALIVYDVHASIKLNLEEQFLKIFLEGKTYPRSIYKASTIYPSVKIFFCTKLLSNYLRRWTESWICPAFACTLAI